MAGCPSVGVKISNIKRIYLTCFDRRISLYYIKISANILLGIIVLYNMPNLACCPLEYTLTNGKYVFVGKYLFGGPKIFVWDNLSFIYNHRPWYITLYNFLRCSSNCPHIQNRCAGTVTRLNKPRCVQKIPDRFKIFYMSI